jgi:hypothetical protein
MFLICVIRGGLLLNSIEFIQQQLSLEVPASASSLLGNEKLREAKKYEGIAQILADYWGLWPWDGVSAGTLHREPGESLHAF